MGNTHTPRSGSMQFWPRVRAKRAYARLRTSTLQKNAVPATFAGYKVGMTHVLVTDNKKNSPTKGLELSWPVTVIECPPVKVIGVRFYKKAYVGKQTTQDVYAEKQEKELSRKVSIKQHNKIENVTEFDDLKLIIATQPKKTTLGKKKPEVFEITLGGNKEQKLTYAKEHIGKEIKLTDVFKEGAQVDVHAISKGKGYQGPVKRFGVDIRQHKSEKTIRGPGSLGGWRGQGQTMYRVAHAGKMGFHQRTELNKQILRISDKHEDVNVSGGYKHYGNVKNTYLLIKGSIIGSTNRLITLTESKRPRKNIGHEAPVIEQVNLESKQGR